MKTVMFWGIMIIAPLFLLAVAFEWYARIYLTYPTIYESDSELGWVPKPNHNYTGFQSDKEGNVYKVEVTTNKYGFRAWGDITSDKTKVLFIGDSFTGDPNMSDEASYFGQVGKLIDAEIFAFGGGGYGTLQELMVVQKYVSKINPDFIVLQFCENDLMNNSFYLEGRSIVRNQKNLRPYLVNGKITYRLAETHPYKLLYKHSRLFKYLDGRLQQFLFAQYNGYYPPPVDAKEKARIREEKHEAVKLTEHLMTKIGRAVPSSSKRLTFSCGTQNKTKMENWLSIAKKSGFVSLPSVSQAVEQAEKEGIPVRAQDGGHWGPKGHRIAGAMLAKELKRLMASEP